jgi:predicted GIY-YIG superfamily endonuclease
MRNKDTFVYVLIKNEEVIYVGMTRNPIQRESMHKQDKDFDHLKIVATPLYRNHAMFLEAALIQSYGKETLLNKGDGNVEYLLKHESKIKECPLCIQLGCEISRKKLTKLIDKHVIHITIGGEVKRKMIKLAKDDGRTLSQYIRMILKKELEKVE